MCGIPQWVSTETGTRVPVRGVVYLHHEGISDGTAPLEWVTLGWSGGEGTARVTRVEESVASIEYEGPAGATLVINGEYGDLSTQLVLDPKWTAPEKAPRVLQYAHHEYSWTCSSADSLIIQIDQAVAAVRARWTVNGHTVDYIEAVESRDGKHIVELGAINCGGESIPVEQLHDGGELELIAIRSDGSEVPIAGMPRHIDLDHMPVTADYSFGFTIVEKQALQLIDTDPGASEPPAGRGLGILVIAVAGFGVIALLYLLKRVERSASDCSPASE